MPRNIAIIGSGFLGLTLALRFSEIGFKVTVFESASEIGGLASSWQIGDVTWDKHYHVTLMSDAFTRSIVEILGLSDEFEWVETKTGFYTGSKLVSMSNALEFLRFPPLDLLSKVRLGGTIFYASRLKDWKALERVLVSDWLRKLSGKKTFERIWKPLLKAKLGDAYLETSAAFIWATIQRMYAARNAGMKREMFGYVRGGYARVLKRFEEILSERGVDIRLNEPVSKVQKLDDGGIEIRSVQNDTSAGANGPASDNERSAAFDIAVLTCPADLSQKMVSGLSEGEKAQLGSIKYQGIVCASVLLKKSLSEFYVTNIIDETPFTGIIEMSALVDKKEFGGKALVYLPKYVPPDDELFERSDAEIEEMFLPELERMYPHFSREDVLSFKVSRVRRVFPLPVLNYSETVPAMKSSVEGVFIVNSTHIVNGTLNVNETVQLAEKFFKTHFGGPRIGSAHL